MSQLSYLDTFVPSKRASLENPNIGLNDPEAWEEAGLLVGRTKSGTRVTHRKALGHAPVWRGVNLISNAIGKVRLFVYKNRADGGREKDKAHAAYPLLRRKPNKYVTALVFKKTLTYHALLYGNGYAAIFRDGRGRPVELLILSPFDTFAIQKNGELWYVTTIAGTQRKVKAEDILHIRGLSFDGIMGHSVIEVLAEALAVGISARDFAARFFGQGANASGILMIPGSLKLDAQRQAIKDFEKIASGIKNQHKVGILQDNVKWQPLTINPEQSQMLGVQKADLITVANVLGMPAYKLGHDARTSYASIEWESQAYLDDALDPWFCAWEEECGDKLLSEAEKTNETHYCEFNRAQLLQTDKLTRVRIAVQEKQWGLTNTNRYLARENEETIGPAGDVFWAPTNMVPIDKLGQAAPAPGQAPTPDKVQGQNSVRAAAMDAVIERLTHLAEVEAEHIRRAAKREKNFVAWMESYYAERLETYDEILAPLVKVWAVSAGRSAPAFLRGVTMELSHRLVDRSRQELLAIAGGCTQDDLSKALDQLGANVNETDLRALVSEILGVI